MIIIGAPGYYFLCKQGHEVDVIPDDMFWNEALSDKFYDCQKRKCKCGQQVEFTIPHYGDINDCIEEPIIWSTKEKRWLVEKCPSLNNKFLHILGSKDPHTKKEPEIIHRTGQIEDGDNTLQFPLCNSIEYGNPNTKLTHKQNEVTCINCKKIMKKMGIQIFK